MATALREWPNVYGALRDDLSEVLKADVEKLKPVLLNKINDEEAVEAIVAEVTMDLNIAIRALERAGAQTDPLAELSNIVANVRRQIYVPA